MTYSIIARDVVGGQLGIAVASRFFAVGSLVPYMAHDAAIATQAFVNPMWGVEGIGRLMVGASSQKVLADFVARDAGQSQRQAHMIDRHGTSAAHTGSQCIEWAGHLIGENVSVAGNMLAGRQVIADAMSCYCDNLERPFAERLLMALQAGEDAGGDKRGRQSAALRIHSGQDYPNLDLRVDDHGDPLSELRRLHSVAGERLVHFNKVLATSQNFSGAPDRAGLDQDIANSEAERRANNISSLSLATSTEPLIK